jgi:hypothetical protein
MIYFQTVQPSILLTDKPIQSLHCEHMKISVNRNGKFFAFKYYSLIVASSKSLSICLIIWGVAEMTNGINGASVPLIA